MPLDICVLGINLSVLGVNIAAFALGCETKDGEAIALLGVDAKIDDATLATISRLPRVTQAIALWF